MTVSLQAFAIPGAIFLSFLAGPLFGILPGIIIVTLVNSYYDQQHCVLTLVELN